MVNDFLIENGVVVSYNGSKTNVVIPTNITAIGSKAFADKNFIKSVIIPEGVTKIEDHAFFNCSIKEVTLPASLKELGYLAFGGQNPLASIKVADGNSSFSSEDGVLYNKDKTTLLMYPQNKKAKEFKTPASVTKIEAFAFASMMNKSHTVVRINEGVKEIGKMAFAGALNAGDVYIPASVSAIGDDAFNGCGLVSKASLYCVKGSDAEKLLKDNNHDTAELLVASIKTQD